MTKDNGAHGFFDFRLRNAPVHAKVLIVGFLCALSLAYLYALANVALVVGWTPRDIAVHYYGSAEVIRTETAAVETTSGEQSFDLDTIEKVTPAAEFGARPSFKNLVAEGHFHLFGMTSFFFALTLLGLFVEVRDSYKIILLGTPYAAIVLDNLSFMATRFLGPKMAYLTAVSGGFMGLSFAALWFLIGFEVFKSQETK
jgi:hypothetical protein